MFELHHITFKVRDMKDSCNFYSKIFGFQEVAKEKLPKSIQNLVENGKIFIFHISNGLLLNLFLEPNTTLNKIDICQQDFSHTEISDHLAFKISPELFTGVIEKLRCNNIKFSYGMKSTMGKAIYCCDPDNHILEIRFDNIRHPTLQNDSSAGLADKK